MMALSANPIFAGSSALGIIVAALALAAVPQCYAAGGMAEMKALTGDAPYLGTGNHEQAPEFFGEALARQYYQNPAYRYNDWYGGGGGGGSRFAQNYYRSPYRYYGTGGGGPPGAGGDWLSGFGSPSPLYRSASSLISTNSMGAGAPFSSGGFYRGRGNDWSQK
uniref:Uncharacterized protein n=1 Tax=Globodera rostochiensis TaxID=31243 RepID=A0A914I6U1_GLORO